MYKIRPGFSGIVLFILILFPVFCFAGRKHLTFTPGAWLAYDYTLQLRLDDARKELNTLKADDPDNYISYFIENYIDFFTLFIGEQRIDFDRLKKKKDSHLALIQKTDPKSPYYLFCQASIQMQWALARLKFGEYFTAFYEIKSAYHLLEENKKKFPKFIPNTMNLGVLHVLLSTIPEEYQWGVRLLGGGMQGSLAQGEKELASVINYSQHNTYIFTNEAYVMYAFTLLYITKDPGRAWSLVRSGNLDASQNPLNAFVLANIAIHSGRNDDAIKYINLAPKGNEYYPFYYLDYLKGSALLNKLSPAADSYLLRYINNFKGMNYLKDACQKLAWSALIRGDVNGYNKYMQRARTIGTAVVDEDKFALRAAQNKVVPQPELLKARLLFDGGYYDQADQQLRQLNVHSLSKRTQQTEYHYRLGRIGQAQGKNDVAIASLSIALSSGRNDPAYFACSAALYLGQIYEKKGDKVNAKKYYSICLDLNPEEYKSSLHQKAQAGLQQL
jgi:predicted negative regulator of RcsB-dependent stress response